MSEDWKQYEKDTFQVLFEIHRVFFKSQNKFLEFKKFIENRAVGVFVQTFINTLRKMYPTLSRSGPKWAFKQHKVFFNTKIDFSLQNFFEENSDEPLKENEEIQKVQCQKQLKTSFWTSWPQGPGLSKQCPQK